MLHSVFSSSNLNLKHGGIFVATNKTSKLKTRKITQCPLLLAGTVRTTVNVAIRLCRCHVINAAGCKAELFLLLHCVLLLSYSGDNLKKCLFRSTNV